MKNSEGAHLEERRIMASLIDKADLTPAERDHLTNCATCTASRHRLAARLDGLADAAVRHTPDRRRRVTLPALEDAPERGWTGWYVGLAATAASVALLVALLWPHLYSGSLGPYGDVSLAAETAADAKLMAEVDDIAEGKLSGPYRNIVPDPGVDEGGDFLDFVAPLDTGLEEG